VFALALGARSASAQETFNSLAGVWWFQIAGKDAGSILVEFSEPAGGAFTVLDVQVTGHSSFGFSRTLGTFFTIADGEMLQLDSKGNVTGTLALTDTSDAAAGDVTIEKGKPNKTFTKLKLKATLAPSGGGSLKVKLNGQRVPSTFPVLTGIDPDGSLSGKKVKSSAMELRIEADELLGLPAYGFSGLGSAKIDGVEQPDVSLLGQVMLAPNNKVFGLLEESSGFDFGTGPASGKLTVPASGVVPKANLKLEADRKLKLKGKLTQAVEPVLKVTPTSFDFGALHLDATAQHTFTVENVGINDLSGEATFVSGSSADFSISGPATYGPLANGDPGDDVVIAFTPSSAGAKSAQVLFGVTGGLGAKLVQLNGTGGIAHIVIDPTSEDFGDVTVGQQDAVLFTVSNDGDGPLSGAATIAGSTDFALALNDTGATQTTIPYTLDAGEQRQFVVRFKPTTTGVKAGSVVLTGGGGVTAVLAGNGL
jgi:hypothetical protein